MPKRTPPDEGGLALIERYESAIITARMERLPADAEPAEQARERADVTALAARIADAMRANYFTRTSSHD
jgi:hypothetical protein